MNGTQVIGQNVQVGSECRIGHFTVIGDNVVLGGGVEIGNNVTICPNARIGSGCRIADNAVVGKYPTVAKTSTLKVSELSPLEVGPGCTIGSGAIVYAGTVMGPECFVADSAQIRERCVLGRRVIVGRGATVENDSAIGDFTKLQTGVYITARTIIEENCFLAPCVVTSNDNYVARTEQRHAKVKGPHIRRGARIGAGAVLLPGVVVGQEALVAAGAIVTKDVPGYQVVMGVPARSVRDVPVDQLIYPREEGVPDESTGV